MGHERRRWQVTCSGSGYGYTPRVPPTEEERKRARRAKALADATGILLEGLMVALAMVVVGGVIATLAASIRWWALLIPVTVVALYGFGWVLRRYVRPLLDRWLP